MKYLFSVVVVSSLMAVSAVAQDCKKPSDVERLCVADLVQKESNRYGTVRVESVNLGLETLQDPIATTIRCFFSYTSDVNYRGGNFVVNMIGANSYSRSSCQKLESNLVIGENPSL
ncbi:MAG TPA: hypothetical protein VNJ01_07305 [Bacteriovoracaceae bacterium]|nr:hypothetical protein [Bacteriovoracaceae bacterium]